MNRGDQKALRRAAIRLNISPQEKLLEYDIGNPLFLILPESFPTPLSPRAKRIDLVASDQALYLHSLGIHRRYGWEEILECSFGDEFFHWRERNGHKCQVHMIRGYRPLAQVVSECIKDYERNLDDTERQARALERSSYDAQDKQKMLRREILDQQNQFKRALGFRGTVFTSAGETLVSSTVALTPRGVEFIIDATLRQLTFSYALIESPEIEFDANTLTANIHDPNFQSFTVQGKTEDQLSQWKADLDRLISFELG